MEPCKVEIELNLLGRGKVILNGEDVSNQVAALQFSAEPQSATILSLHYYIDELRFNGTAIVKDGLPDQTVLSRLRAIDPEELEQDALTSLSMGDKLVPAIVAKIIEKVTQDATQS